MSGLARVVGLFLVCAGTGQAAAACSTGNAQSADFGAVGSVALRAAVQTTSTRDAGIECSGQALQPWEAQDTYFRVTLSSANGGLLGPTGDLLDYRLYASADRNNGAALIPAVPLDLVGLGVIDALGLLQSASGRVMPLYLAAAGGSNVAAGGYEDTATLAWEWRYCTGSSGSGVCSSYDTGSGVTTVPVNLVVQNDCSIAAADLDFGSAALPSAFAAANGSIAVTCTKGSAYSVGLGDGQNPAEARRNMRSAQGELLAYDLFQGVSGIRWGSVGAERRSSAEADVNPGPGTGVDKQVFNYNAKVYADQTAVPVGRYVDTVLVDVAF